MQTLSRLFISSIFVLTTVASGQDSLNVSRVTQAFWNHPITSFSFVIQNGLVYNFGIGIGLPTSTALSIIDLTNPSVQRQIGFLPLHLDWNASIVISNNNVVITESDTFAVVDVSNPDNLILRSFTLAQNGVSTTAMVDDLFYICGMDSVLRAYDLSHPEDPQLVDSIWLGVLPAQCIAKGRIVILTGDECRIVTLNQADELEVISTIDHFAKSISVEDNLLAIGSGNDGSYLYDITNSASPQQLTWIEGAAHHVMLWQNRLLMGWTVEQRPDGIDGTAECSIVRVLNLSDVRNPRSQGELVYRHDFDWGGPIYKTDGNVLISGVNILYRDPATFEAEILEALLGCNNIFIHNGQKYANKLWNLGAFDFVGDITIAQSSYIRNTRIGSFFASYGQFLFTSDWRSDEYVTVLNLGNPDRIEDAGRWRSHYNGRNYVLKSVVIKDHYLFAITANSHLLIYDCANAPAALELISVTPLPFTPLVEGNPIQIETDHDQVWISSNQGGIIGVDVTDLRNPRINSLIENARRMTCFSIQDTVMYVGFAERGKGLQIYNIATPLEPYLVDSLPEFQTISSMDIQAQHCFLSGVRSFEEQYHAGLYVLDLTNNVSPRVTGHYTFRIDSLGQDNSGPKPVDYLLEAPLLYTAENNYLGVYDVSEILAAPPISDLTNHPVLFALSTFPNPFNSSVTISFTVGAQGLAPLRLAIFDISGRLVADLTAADPPRSAGMHKVTWDASSVGAGVYFIRLEAGTEVRTEKIVLMR